jgi:hypothetical protein
VPCDSHGLQLLIKDILKTEPFASTIAKAQTIVSTFHQAKKQYAILRTKQEKPMAFILSVIIRWGTQYGLALSVLKNKQALFAWVADPRAQVGKKKGINTLSSTILDAGFWRDLSELTEILKPIHKAQKMSESNSSTLAKVMPRWQQLEKELERLAQVYPYLDPILAPNGVFKQRLLTQTQPIHWAAFILDPTSTLRFIDAKGRETAIQWILRYSKDKKKVHCSLIDYLERQNGFTKDHLSSYYIDNPIRYWESYFGSEDHDELSRFAVRVFKTIANSVASGRAFSAMGLIVSKLRSRLGTEKANMLIFIYMNQRVLDKANDLLLGDWVEKSDDDQV